MSIDREKLTALKESFWKEPEPIKEEVKETVVDETVVDEKVVDEKVVDETVVEDNETEVL